MGALRLTRVVPARSFFLMSSACSHLLAENSRCTAWSLKSLVEDKYELMSCPMCESLLGKRMFSTAGSGPDKETGALVVTAATSWRCFVSICTCVLLPHLSSPSNRMNAPRPLKLAIFLERAKVGREKKETAKSNTNSSVNSSLVW